MRFSESVHRRQHRLHSCQERVRDRLLHLEQAERVARRERFERELVVAEQGQLVRIPVAERVRVHIESGGERPRDTSTQEAMIAELVIQIADEHPEDGPPPELGRIGTRDLREVDQIEPVAPFAVGGFQRGHGRDARDARTAVGTIETSQEQHRAFRTVDQDPSGLM